MRRTGAVVVPGLLLGAHLGGELEGPAAVVDASGPGGGRVRALNAAAHQAGLRLGQTRVQALARVEDLHLAGLEPARVRAAQGRLLEAVATISPEVEDAFEVAAQRGDPAAGAGLVRFDARGLSLLYPRPGDLLEAVATATAGAGFSGALTAMADGPFAAAVLAAFAPGTVSPPGGDRLALAPLPLEALAAPEAPGLPPDALEHLRLLSVRTAGAFAALPASAVETRFGREGLGLHRLALGEDPRPLLIHSGDEALILHLVLEAPALTREALLRVLAGPLAVLLGRLEGRGLGLARLDLAYRPEGRGPTLHRHLEVLEPFPRPDTLERLLRLDLEAHPPGAPVAEVALHAARTLPRGRGQGDLFTRRAGSEGLARAVTRLRGRLGAGAVGRPVLDDRHRPEAGFHLDAGLAAKAAPPGGALPPGPSVALRLYGSPRPVAVDCDDQGRPARLQARRAQSAGPFPMSGEWWAAPYDRAYYEVETDEAVLWVFRDASDGRWYVHGVFD